MKLGDVRSDLLATKHPTTLDIAWAAGVFEGEGHARPCRNGLYLMVSQKDTEILYKLRDLFGGSVRQTRKSPSLHAWLACGVLARGFLMTTYTFLSQRRRAQARRALGV